jgi:hypothetical protein
MCNKCKKYEKYRATANQKKYTILNIIIKPTVLQIPVLLSTETISVESF